MNVKRQGNAKRKQRTVSSRHKEFGNYCVVTDGQETEPNYFCGLRDSIPAELRDHIKIEVCRACKPQNLVKKTESIREDDRKKDFLIRRYWIVFDRDEVPTFDAIIADAQSKGFEVGWSNPCFELWLAGYFSAGSVPNYESSKECVAAFEKLFKGRANFEYKKNVQNLYDVLKNKGDERAALQNAETKHRNERAVKSKPSEMCCTTVYRLVKEIVAARDGFSAR